MQVHIALGKLLQDVSDKTIEHNNWFYEYKVDGLRTLIFSDGNIVSRYGNTLYIDVNKDIIKQIPRGYVLDCESFANNVWQTMSIKSKTKSKHIQNNIKIYVFDIVDQDTILKGKVYEVPYEQRKQELQKLLKHISTKDKRFKYVPHIRATKNSREYFMEIAKQYYNRGFEGAMFKKAGHFYVPSRTSNWIKAKLFADIDVKVVDVIIQNNRVKAFVCEYKGHRFNVGSGLTEEQRRFIAEHKQKFIGKKLNIKSMHYTEAGIPRVPIFVGFYATDFDKDFAQLLEQKQLLKLS